MGSKANSATLATSRMATRGLDRYILIVMCIQVCSIALEAPIRFALSKIGLTNLLYLRDALIFSCVVGVLIKSTQDRADQHIRITLGALLYLLVVSTFSATLMGNSVFPSLFAIKLFNNTLFGITCTIVALRAPSALYKLIIFIFVTSCAGIYLNKVIGVFPWDGSSYETAFGTVEVNRIWWIAGGERRLAGFCRASYTAAAIIAATATVIQFKEKNWLIKLLATVMALTAIYFTTSKGVILALLVTSIISFTKPHTLIRSFITTASALAFTILAFFVPLVSWYLSPPANTVRHAPGFLSSFADRAANTWPEALNEYTSWYNWLLGKGLGGVGTPSSFAGLTSRVNPIDNIHLFLHGNFGLIGSALFFLLALKTIQNSITPKTSEHAFIACAMATLLIGYGNVTNILDDPFSPIAIGVSWGLMALAQRSANKTQNILSKKPAGSTARNISQSRVT